jgi:hypothetical protein
VASRRLDDGWSAEFSIPWRTLRYPEGDADGPWGINVLRVIQRKNEKAMWRAWQRGAGGLRRVSAAGHLGGLNQLPHHGFDLDAKPFLLAAQTRSLSQAAARFDRRVRHEAGLDLKTEVQPGLVLDLTFNTDFAQVEVDDVPFERR